MFLERNSTMKTFFTLVLVIIITQVSFSQSMNVYTNTGTSSFVISQIDSITFSGFIDQQREFILSGDVGGVGVIMKANEDFSQITQLTDADTGCAYPKYSPDGSKIAYCRINGSQGHMDVWVMNSDGTNKHRVTFNDSLAGYMPTWHNDGNQILYYRHATWATATQDQVIMIVNSDGTNNRVLFDHPGDKDMDPMMNPTNSDEVVQYFDPINNAYTAGILIHHLTSGIDDTVKTFYPTYENQFAPGYNSWSPNGQYILYRELNSSSHARLIRYDRNTKTKMTIVDIATGTGNDVAGRFSPDGSKIYYVKRNSTSVEIYQSDIDGSNATMLYSWTGGVCFDLK